MDDGLGGPSVFTIGRKVLVSILLVMDDGLGEKYFVIKNLITSQVSILLVMDDGLGVTLQDVEHTSFLLVSILLVMDDGLGGCGDEYVHYQSEKSLNPSCNG